MISRVQIALTRLFVQKSDHTIVQLIRYLCVAFIAFSIDFGVLYLLTDHLHFFYMLSAAISFCLALVANYFLSTTWVFSERNLQSKRVEFIAFGAIGGAGLLLTVGGMWLLTSIVGVYYLVSKLMVTGVVFFWNFLARKYFLFNNGS